MLGQENDTLLFSVIIYLKAIFSHSEAEGNQRKRHLVRMLRLLTKIFYDC